MTRSNRAVVAVGVAVTLGCGSTATLLSAAANQGPASAVAMKVAQGRSDVSTEEKSKASTIEWLDERPVNLDGRYLNGTWVPRLPQEQIVVDAQSVDIELVQLRVLLEKARLQPGTNKVALRLQDHLRRLLALGDAMKLPAGAARREALVALGVRTTTAQVGKGTMTAVRINDVDRLRVFRPDTAAAWADLSSRLEQNQGGPHASDVSSMRDEVDDAYQVGNDNIAYYAASADEAEAMANDIANTDWSGGGENCAAPAAGPSAGEDSAPAASCWTEAAAAIGSFLATSGIARYAIQQINSALDGVTGAIWGGVSAVTAALDSFYAVVAGSAIGYYAAWGLGILAGGVLGYCLAKMMDPAEAAEGGAYASVRSGFAIRSGMLGLARP